LPQVERKLLLRRGIVETGRGDSKMNRRRSAVGRLFLLIAANLGGQTAFAQ